MKFASTTTDPGRGGRAQGLKNNKRAEIGSYNTNSIVVTSLYTPAYSKTISDEARCPYSEDFAQNGIFCTTKKQNVKNIFTYIYFAPKPARQFGQTIPGQVVLIGEKTPSKFLPHTINHLLPKR